MYAFGPFEIDADAHQLRRQGQPVSMSNRYLRVLLHLAAHAGAVVSKDELVTAAWGDVAVGDNSLEQAISALRRVLGADPGGRQYVETVPRQGYRLAAAVVRTVPAASDDALDALLAPHRALLDGRAALETLDRGEIVRARDVFAHVVAMTPDAAPAHVGLANACVLQFEMTRADETPDAEALRLAAHHAYEACRLDTQHGEAWATLSFVLERLGKHTDALAAARRAIALEPDNWRHHLRLSSIAWGEERLRAARRTLALLPGCALAHWLAATVLVARQMLDETARELAAGIAAESQGDAHARFTGVALHWLLGLVHLAQRDESQALQHFERELANEDSGHLYARESCANTWYAIGALHLRHGRAVDARMAFEHALERVRRHPMARLGLAAVGGDVGSRFGSANVEPSRDSPPVEELLCAAAVRVLRGSPESAAQLVDESLSRAAPPANAWLLPVEPLIDVSATPDAWTSALARLRASTA